METLYSMRGEEAIFYNKNDKINETKEFFYSFVCEHAKPQRR